LIGKLSSLLGHLEEAQEAFGLLVELSRASGSEAAELRAMYQVAVGQKRFFAQGRGSLDEVIHEFQGLIEAAEGRTLDAVAFSHLELGQLLKAEEARNHLEECLAMSRDLGAPQQAACLLAQANLELAFDSEAAEKLFRRALEVMKDNREPYLTLRAWSTYLSVAWATKPRKEALDLSFEVLDAIEAQWILQQRDSGSGEHASASFLGEWSEAYHWLAGKLFATTREDDDVELLNLAFEVSERMRGRVLLDALRISAISQEASLDEVALAEVREENFALVDRLKKSLWAMTEPRSSELTYERVSHPEIVSLAEIQSLLEEDQALLSFQFLNDPDVYGRFTGGSWVMVVRREGIETFRLPSARKLRGQLRFFRSKAAAGSEDRGLTERLYDQLLAKALESLPESIEHLILVPDGELYSLPFAALKGSGDDLPLGARFALSTVPSATLWSRWHRGEEERPPAVVLAFADPDQDHAPEVLASIAKEPAALPRARREGRRLTRLFGGGSRLATGNEATESFLRSTDLDPFGLLHFATHTVVDHETPDRSAVILAAGSGKEDGLLRPSEIAGLALDERLVVLSACDTASGEILRGEGVMGLARAFFVAGARTVVGTLWPVEDGDAERFFVGFYDRLFEGQSVSEAVRGTQDELWRAGAPAQAWAGIVVLGDGELALPPGSRTTPARWWLWALLLVGGGLLLWIGRRPRHSGA